MDVEETSPLINTLKESMDVFFYQGSTYLWLARLTTLIHPSMDDIVSGWQLHTIITISWIPNSLSHYEVSQLQDKIVNNCTIIPIVIFSNHAICR